MARRLKTYQTSIGFFDLALAAPSMKAAAEAWGTQTDIFKKGFATETHDAAIVAATMAKPGVVLKRPVGSNEPFSEHAELPHLLNIDRVKERKADLSTRSEKPLPGKTDDKAAKAAALAFAREQKRRDALRQKEEIARARRRKQQEQSFANAERALKSAEQEHDMKVKKIEQDRAALEKQSQAEDARWKNEKQKLESALRRSRY